MIYELNPWWMVEEDREILHFKQLEFKVYPEWINKISLKPFSLNFVIGPRRAGKTIGIKLLIHKLLEKEENPYSVFYFTCDVLESYKELIEVLEDYLSISEEKNVKTGYIFLDEVTLLEDWWRAIKFFVDRRRLANFSVTLTGSSSLLLTQHYETFGGRMGHGKKIYVLPLSFHEFYNLFYKDIIPPKLKEIFKKYLETGGFLSVLNKEMKESEFVSLIKADIKRIDRSTKLAKEVLGEIFSKAPSACSYHSIAQSLGISVNTVKEYLEIFENLFILKQIDYRGLDNKIYPRKEKKFMIRDPFIAKSISLWTRKELRKDFLYEWIVQEHLYRKFGEIYYYKNKYEIDCIAGNLKVEVKAGKPHRKFPRGIVVLDEEDLPRFLIELFEK